MIINLKLFNSFILFSLLSTVLHTADHHKKALWIIFKTKLFQEKKPHKTVTTPKENELQEDLLNSVFEPEKETIEPTNSHNSSCLKCFYCFCCCTKTVEKAPPQETEMALLEFHSDSEESEREEVKTMPREVVRMNQPRHQEQPDIQ